MSLRRLYVSVLAALAPAAVLAQPGNPNDIYALSDGTHDVFQYERNSPWNYVPGTYAGSLGAPYNQVFSNAAQTQSVYPYLGAVAGPTDNFFIGGFVGLTEIDSTTGAFVQSVGAGIRLGPAEAPNGNIVVGGPTGVEEYNSTSGAFVRTVTATGDGYNLHTFSGGEMFVANWVGGAGFGIKRYNFITGASSGATIPVAFAPQEIGIGPDGALYATALYEGPGVEGLWRYDFGSSSWSQYIDVQSLAGGGPHGFTWDPVSLDIFMAFNTGQIYRFSSGGTFLNLIDTVPAKLTDILFKEVVPEPASLGLLAIGSLFLLRRR